MALRFKLCIFLGLFALLACFSMWHSSSASVVIPGAVMRTIEGGGTTGGGGQAFSDNFDRADSGSLGASWTDEANGHSIISNQANAEAGSFAANCTTYNTQTDTVEQYALVTFASQAGNRYPGLIFRFTDSSSGHYRLEVQEGTSVIALYYEPSVGGSSVAIGSSQNVGAFVSLGITCSGTGASTVWRVWKNPGAPDGSNVSAGTWAGDATPDHTWTDDTATYADTGKKVGLTSFQSAADGIKYNDWYAGDLD